MSQQKKSGGVDLLHGPILKALILFMIPVMISNIFQQLYNAVDTAIVGNYLGENSLAAIGACASIFDMIFGPFHFPLRFYSFCFSHMRSAAHFAASSIVFSPLR